MDIDITIVVQFAVLLVLLLSLGQLLFKPMLRILDERQARSAGDNLEAQTRESQAETQQKAYQVEMRNARDEAQKVYDRLRLEGMNQEKQLLATTRLEIANFINKNREQLQKDVVVAETQLQPQIQALSNMLVGKLLGREVRS